MAIHHARDRCSIPVAFLCQKSGRFGLSEAEIAVKNSVTGSPLTLVGNKCSTEFDVARPVIILGAARSGTTLLARIMGSSDEVFLITEVAVHLKHRNCPEDRSGVSDAELWRNHFTFGAWEADRPRPVCERPVFDLSKIESMRARYLEMAGSKRLVIKNPLGLARVDMLKVMFPDALFVFSLRAPWPTIQSATVKGNGSYIVPTEFVSSLPKNFVLRAAATWAELIDVLNRERDANWIVVRHEEIVARPYALIEQIYDRIGLAQVSVAHAARLPEVRVRNYSFIKYQLMGHPYRSEICALVEERARAFGYDPNLAALPGSGLRYAAETWLSQLRTAKPQKAHRKQRPLLARA